MTLAQKLKQLREEKGWSKYKLCQTAQIGMAAVYQIEEGITTKPSYQTMYRLSEALEIDLESWAPYIEGVLIRKEEEQE